MVYGGERGGKSHKRPLHLLTWFQVPSSSELCWPLAPLPLRCVVSNSNSSAVLADELLGASLTRLGSASPPSSNDNPEPRRLVETPHS